MTAFRRIFWFVLIVGWLLVVLRALVVATPGVILSLIVLAVVSWIVAWKVFAWFFGLRRLARRHLGITLENASQIQRPLNPHARSDLLFALHQCVPDHGQVVGIHDIGFSLLNLLQRNHEPLTLEWDSIQTDVDEWSEVSSNGLFLLTLDQIPFIAAVRQETDYSFEGFETGHPVLSKERSLHLVCRSRSDAQTIRKRLMDLAQQQSILKGRTLTLRSSEESAEIRIRFSETAPVTKDRIVLPEEIFAIVHRSALAQVDRAALLQRAGHRSRSSVLFHGPPGTGKTLLTRFLISSRDDYTTILVQGFQRGIVRESFRVARYCQPSIVVIEDVDLIAVRREEAGAATMALHELMDELDGLAPESRTLVIMTSNRPDVLEPALASRPGRISQAVEIPLPDAECRRRLLELFTKQLDTGQLTMTQWVNRTEGASAAFLEELIRRSILFSVERSAAADGKAPPLLDEDVDAAMHEIVTSGGALTQRLLGFSDSPESDARVRST